MKGFPHLTPFEPGSPRLSGKSRLEAVREARRSFWEGPGNEVLIPVTHGGSRKPIELELPVAGLTIVTLDVNGEPSRPPRANPMRVRGHEAQWGN